MWILNGDSQRKFFKKNTEEFSFVLITEKKKQCNKPVRNLCMPALPRALRVFIISPVVPIDLITVFEAILTSRQTRLEITLFVWKSDGEIKMASKTVIRSMLIKANQVLTVCQGLFILSKNGRQKILSYFNKS